MKVTIIFLDGYKGWNVSRVKHKQVVGPFDETTCRDALASAEGYEEDEASLSLKELFGDDPVVKGNIITCMGEESGVVFVREI